jgi:hypothetical protein
LALEALVVLEELIMELKVLIQYLAPLHQLVAVMALNQTAVIILAAQAAQVAAAQMALGELVVQEIHHQQAHLKVTMAV